MTNDQEDKIIQLLVSENGGELGFQLAKGLGYSEVEFIEYLIDKHGRIDITHDWCNLLFLPLNADHESDFYYRLGENSPFDKSLSFFGINYRDLSRSSPRHNHKVYHDLKESIIGFIHLLKYNKCN